MQLDYVTDFQSTEANLDSVGNCAYKVISRYGKIDTIVNNAGIFQEWCLLKPNCTVQTSRIQVHLISSFQP